MKRRRPRPITQGHLAAALRRGAERELYRRNHRSLVALRSFVQMIDVLRKNARNRGYALAVHGTLLRDIDLIAVPWIAKPKAPSTLKRSLHGIINVFHPHAFSNRKPELKPQGRLAWSIHLGNGTYIDLSVVPPR